jgi:hypothetical protein
MNIQLNALGQVTTANDTWSGDHFTTANAFQHPLPTPVIKSRHCLLDNTTTYEWLHNLQTFTPVPDAYPYASMVQVLYGTRQVTVCTRVV